MKEANTKINRAHLSRDAIVYIRQSSAQQVRKNHESRQRQYALVERARSLGWPQRAIKTVDDDQGSTGTTSIHREGFKRLMAEIGAGQVGVVMALEASRLARSNADWHRLVEICVVTNTLLGDETAIYDPRNPNDRLLLGVKGTISEAELFTLKQRLHEGRWNKARRGELVRSLPVGYRRQEDGQVVKDPDHKVQSRLRYVFDLFDRHRVARQVLVQLVDERLKLPVVVWGGPDHGDVAWKEPELSAIIRLLHNPTYAGAYVYGQWEYDSFHRSPSNGKATVHPRAIEDWSVCLRDAYPAYITWEQFLENQKTLHDNWFRGDRQGAPRKGRALLQGVVFCGCCGERMRVNSYSTKEQRVPAYTCCHAYQKHGGETCQSMTSRGIDEAITNLFLDAVSPARIDIALAAVDELQSRRDVALREWDAELQQAEYNVQLARRRYEAADPDNRLVASELETRWEEALRDLGQRQRDRQEFINRQQLPLSARDERLVKELAGDLATVWHAETTTMEDRKKLIRFLIRRVHLDGVREEGKIHLDVEWHTGAHSSLAIDRLAVGVWAPKTPVEVEQRIKKLLPDNDHATIADMLNREGLRSAKGLLFTRSTVCYIVRSRGWGRNGTSKSR